MSRGGPPTGCDATSPTEAPPLHVEFSEPVWRRFGIMSSHFWDPSCSAFFCTEHSEDVLMNKTLGSDSHFVMNKENLSGRSPLSP